MPLLEKAYDGGGSPIFADNGERCWVDKDRNIYETDPGSPGYFMLQETGEWYSIVDDQLVLYVDDESDDDGEPTNNDDQESADQGDKTIVFDSSSPSTDLAPAPAANSVVLEVAASLDRVVDASVSKGDLTPAEGEAAKAMSQQDKMYYFAGIMGIIFLWETAKNNKKTAVALILTPFLVLGIYLGVNFLSGESPAKDDSAPEAAVAPQPGEQEVAESPAKEESMIPMEAASSDEIKVDPKVQKLVDKKMKVYENFMAEMKTKLAELDTLVKKKVSEGRADERTQTLEKMKVAIGQLERKFDASAKAARAEISKIKSTLEAAKKEEKMKGGNNSSK